MHSLAHGDNDLSPNDSPDSFHQTLKLHGKSDPSEIPEAEKWNDTAYARGMQCFNQDYF